MKPSFPKPRADGRPAPGFCCFLLLAVFGIFGCDPPQPQRLPSGVEITILAQGRGESGKDGDYAIAHYRVQVDGGPWLEDTRARGIPWVFRVGDPLLMRGMLEGLFGIRAGERRRVRIPKEQAYDRAGKPPHVPPGSNLVYEIELVEWFKTLEPRLQYRVLKEGDAAPPTPGARCVMRYTALLPITGRVLDSANLRGRPIEFELGSQRVLPGIEIAAAKMRVGAVWQLVVPAELAYGPGGIVGSVPAGSDLWFEIELVGLR